MTFKAGLLAFANLEIRHALLRLAAHRLLPGDDAQFLLRLLDLRLLAAADASLPTPIEITIFSSRGTASAFL